MKPLRGVQFVSEPIPEFVGEFRAARGKNIWMMDDEGIMAPFPDAIDEFSIHGKCSGKPCIRGLRITVRRVASYRPVSLQ